MKKAQKTLQEKYKEVVRQRAGEAKFSKGLLRDNAKAGKALTQKEIELKKAKEKLKSAKTIINVLLKDSKKQLKKSTTEANKKDKLNIYYQKKVNENAVDIQKLLEWQEKETQKIEAIENLVKDL